MRNTLSLMAAALIAMASQFGAPAAQARNGVGLGLGIVAGVAAAVIISDAARAEGYRRGGYCRRLLNMCDDGEGWACRKFHYRCQ